jgi:hypothetical protein
VAVNAPADSTAPSLSPWPIGPLPPPPPALPGRRGRRRWWLIGGAAVWVLVLFAVALVSERRDRPTVPEQRDTNAAVAAVDRTTGALLAAVGPDRAFAIGPLVFDTDCQVTPVRSGADTSRTVTVHVTAEQAPTALDAIGAALPAGFEAEVTHGRTGTVHQLRADAGDFIAVRGTVSDGVITLRARSGCRPLDGPAPAPPVAAVAPVPPALEQALGALGVTGEFTPVTETVACPNGVTARTVTVDGMSAPADLSKALRAVSEATVDEPDRYAYRVDATSIVVTATDGRARVTASTGC